jgi:hypothetical protein
VTSEARDSDDTGQGLINVSIQVFVGVVLTLLLSVFLLADNREE